MKYGAIPLPNVDRCRAFWQRQLTDRPLLATWVGSYQFTDLFRKGLASLPEGIIQPGDLNPEYFRDDYEALFKQHCAASGDVPWAAFPLAVMPWAEAIAGCPIVHRGGNIWAEPWIENYEIFEENGGFTENIAWLEKLLEFTRWLVKLSAGRFPIAVSLLRGPADLLAAMRGAQQGVLDLIDHPDSVQYLLNVVTEQWIEVAQAQLQEIPMFADGYGWNIQNLWSEEPGTWFQDDAIAFWSPSLYRRHVMQLEKQLSQSMLRTGCHLHSAAIFTVPELVKFEDLDVIEMNLDVVGKSIQEMIPTFQNILQSHRLYIWGQFSEGDLRLMRRELPCQGLALQLMDDSPEAVCLMVSQVEEIWR